MRQPVGIAGVKMRYPVLVVNLGELPWLGTVGAHAPDLHCAGTVGAKHIELPSRLYCGL